MAKKKFDLTMAFKACTAVYFFYCYYEDKFNFESVIDFEETNPIYYTRNFAPLLMLYKESSETLRGKSEKITNFKELIEFQQKIEKEINELNYYYVTLIKQTYFEVNHSSCSAKFSEFCKVYLKNHIHTDSNETYTPKNEELDGLVLKLSDYIKKQEIKRNGVKDAS